jgi:primosomal replication protein N
MNRLVLQAQLVERGPLRYTPAGLPALDLSLMHESQVSEDGQPRKISLELKAVGIGDITAALNKMTLGGYGQFGGFLAGFRNGRGMRFHITEVGPVA